jgi:hypothetical protein
VAHRKNTPRHSAARHIGRRPTPCAGPFQHVEELSRISVRILAAEFARVVLDTKPSEIKEGAANAGQWPCPWPASKSKSWRQSPQVQPINRHSLRNGFNGVLRALPGDRALLPPSRASSSLAHLTPASGCQDHTTSPSASAPFVRTSNSCASPRRPSHPAPRFVTTRDPPLLPGQDARIMLLIWAPRQDIF